MNVGAGGMNLFHHGNHKFPIQNTHNGFQRGMANSFTQMTRTSDKENYSYKPNALNNQGQYGSNVINDSINYANSLSTARSNKKSTDLQIKKMKYDFKAISTQIMRSKTSFSARQAASRARREVIRLKCQRQSGKYDDEELQNAIVHAQAMERVAKKKARHLEEEEMVKVTGGPCQGELDGKEMDERVDYSQEDINEEESQQLQEIMEDGNEQLMDVMNEMTQEVEEQMYEITQEQMCDITQEQMQELLQQMQEQMQEQLQDDMYDSLELTVEQEMDPADFKMMKIKHRSEEMKAIAKADGEYLKAMFEKYQTEKSGISGTFGTIISSVPDCMPSVDVVSGGFDISI